jgi:hypothetical protein
LSDDWFSSDSEQSSSSTQKLWKPAEDAAKTIFQGGMAAYNNSGTMNANQKSGLSRTAGLARQGVPNLGSLFSTQKNLLANGGMTSGMQNAAGLLKGIASGNQVEDPRLQQMLDTNADRAANAAATRFGGGRYGSAAIGNGVGSAVADANNATMLQSNENARNRQLQAQGMLGQLASTGANNMATWASMTPTLNELRYDGATRLGSVGDAQQDFQWNRARNLTNLVGGLLGTGATTQSTGTAQNNPSMAQNLSSSLGILGMFL